MEEDIWKGKCLEEKKDRQRREGEYLRVGKIVAAGRVEVGNIKGSIREVTQTSQKLVLIDALDVHSWFCIAVYLCF